MKTKCFFLRFKQTIFFYFNYSNLEQTGSTIENLKKTRKTRSCIRKIPKGHAWHAGHELAMNHHAVMRQDSKICRAGLNPTHPLKSMFCIESCSKLALDDYRQQPGSITTDYTSWYKIVRGPWIYKIFSRIKVQLMLTKSRRVVAISFLPTLRSSIVLHLEIRFVEEYRTQVRKFVVVHVLLLTI